MSTSPRARIGSRRQNREAGYGLLLALFLVASALVAAALAAPNLITEGRRQKEDELIWRGEQYKLAIGRYYRKTGRFPPSLEELAKGYNGIHFLRKAYKDPVNTEDGSWRPIYLAPNGQLIGSVRFFNMAQYHAAQLPGATQPTATASDQEGDQSNQGNSSAQATPPTGIIPPIGATPPGAPGAGVGQGAQPTPFGQPTPPFGAGAQTTPPGQAGFGGTQAAPFGQQPGQQPGQPGQQSSASSSDFGQSAVGGNLIGVGSKIKKKSVKIYKAGKTYREWEFIWDPTAGTQVVPVGAPVVPGQPGTPQTPANPNANPNPNPNPNPIPPLSPQAPPPQ